MPDENGTATWDEIKARFEHRLGASTFFRDGFVDAVAAVVRASEEHGSCKQVPRNAAMTTTAAATTHRHRHTATTTTERPYRGPVAVQAHQNPAAHGNVERRETCECGAIRRVLVNGRHRESTGWA